MTNRLVVQRGLGPSWAELEATDPENPFLTPSYAAARRMGNAEPVLLERPSSGRDRVLAALFLRTSRVNRVAEIPSAPPIPQHDPFWRELLRWCRTQRVTRLVVDSFGARRAEIPSIAAEAHRHPRWEFHLDLTSDPSANLSSNHRRHLKQAAKAGLSLAVATSEAAVTTHLALMREAQERRANGAARTPPPDPAPFHHLVKAGAGQLFHAVRASDGVVLSSALVLRSTRGGYHHSSGNHAEGMECGASHFLFFEAANRLRQQGATLLNLGGVREHETGIRTFKERFGPKTVPLVKVAFDVAAPWQRLVLSAASLVQRFSFSMLLGLIIIGADPGAFA